MSELTPEDVREILRLVEEAGFGEFELETPRFSLRLRKDAPAVDAPAAVGPVDGLVDVVAPMVGTFYRAAGPGEAPFVEVGSVVAAETQVCLLEVMKLFTAVPAGVAGTVAEVCREDGTAVEYGDALFRIRPA